MLFLSVTALLIGLACGLPFDKRASAPFGYHVVHGTVTSHSVGEASGLAASRRHPGILYTHNDSGDRARVFAIDSRNGNRLATLEIDNAGNLDWEDIAVGLCHPGSSEYCIYIGETGSVGGPRNIIYKVKEPANIYDQHLPLEDSLHYSWSEHDCETLMVSPSSDVYLVSKKANAHHALMAKIPSYAWDHHEFHISETRSHSLYASSYGPVGGDISPNGGEMVLKLYDKILYYTVHNGDYFGAFSGGYHTVPYSPEPQGEAVCFDVHAAGLYTLSERHNQPLYYYPRV